MLSFFRLVIAGVHRREKLPGHNKRGDGERRGRVGSLQTAVPDVDREGADSRSGQGAHERESGYVSFHLYEEIKRTGGE